VTADEAPGDSNTNFGDAILALAAVAHEMRGPLAAIETCTAAFQLKLQGREDLARDAQRFFDRLRRNTKVLARMVNDLLAVGNAQGISETLQRKPVDLVSIVSHAIAAAPSGATVRFVERPSGSAVVAGDEDRIGQVVSNLIRNAIEHGTGWVEVQLFQNPAGWTLVVDNAGEIAPELQGRLFEPFVRGRSGGQGLGLGLHLVRRLVEAHGGTVTCRSTDGRVSFVVFLPL
jgi:two-component system sensor histidine kinase/response regulator